MDPPSVPGMVSRKQSNLSAVAGVSVDFGLRAGTSHGDRSFLLAANLSGTSPGIGLGSLTIPLNVDAFTQAKLENLNSPSFMNFNATMPP